MGGRRCADDEEQVPEDEKEVTPTTIAGDMSESTCRRVPLPVTEELCRQPPSGVGPLFSNFFANASRQGTVACTTITSRGCIDSLGVDSSRMYRHTRLRFV